MHIILGLLTLLTAFFIAYKHFNDAGFSLSSINPFLWKRRRDWDQRRQTNPLFILENNQDVAATLWFIIAKLDGELTRESKTELLNDYQTQLNMDANDAQQTLQQVSFMLEQYPIVRADIASILNPECLGRLTDEQRQIIINHLPIIAEREGSPSDEQQQWITDIKQRLSPKNQQAF